MSGNTLGKLFCVTSFGESHGPAIGCVVDGCPPGLSLSEADIQHDLDRRRPGTSRHVTQRKEPDKVEILSGVFEGKTTGTPIALLIRNVDQRSKDYGNIAETFRPGHADYTYWQKYGIRDYRGGGRQSARETAVRVAAAAIARKWLAERYGIAIRGYMSQLGPIEIGFKTWDSVDQNPFFSPDPDIVPDLEAFMDRLRKSGDSCGARITVIASGAPVGWGEPVYDKLDADIAYALMSSPEGFLSNNAGGILGGISTGQDIVANIAVKPTSSIRLDRRSIDKAGNPVVVNTHGRHDPCVGIRATPIAEAMLALVLADHALRHRAQNADVTTSTPEIPAQASQEAIEKLRAAVSLENPDADEA
jgi:chorismate synthase